MFPRLLPEKKIHASSGPDKSPWFRSIILAISAGNVIASLFPDRLQWHAGKIAFPAQTPFKPLLLLNTVLLLCLCSGRAGGKSPSRLWQAWQRYCYSWKGLAAIALLPVCLYGQVFPINFVHNDWTHRYIAAGLTSPKAIGQLFVKPQPDGMYRPLTFLSFLADYCVFKNAIWGYHLQNILLHACNALLLVFLALELKVTRSVAYLAGILFAVNAVHFEAVLWPAARFDLIATFFSLLCLIWSLRFCSEPGGGFWYGVLASGSFLLGILAKETTYSLILVAPFLFVVRSAWHLEDLDKRKAARLYTIFGVCALLLLGVRIVTFGSIGGYAYATGEPALADISLKAAYLLVERSAGLTPFGINCAFSAGWGKVIAAAYAVVAAILAVTYRSTAVSAAFVGSPCPYDSQCSAGDYGNRLDTAFFAA